MSIYIVDASIKNTRISSFEEHGLQGCAPTTINNSGIFVIPTKVVTAHVVNMISNLQNYATAQCADRAFVDSVTQKNVLRFYDAIPVTQPACIINVKGFGERDEFQAWGFEREDAVNFPGEFMISSNISLDNLKRLWTYGPDPFGTALAGNVNPAGLYAFFMSWKAVHLFQHTIGGRFEQRPLPLIHVDDDAVVYENEGVPMASLHTKMVKLYNDPAEMKEVIGSHKTGTGSYPLVTPIRSIYTRSAFTTTTRSFRAVDDGFVFPYFHDMLLPDNDYVAGVFFRYFSRCLSDTSEGTMSLLPILRKGFKSLRSTRQGRELQHVMFGVQSAIDTGALLRIIVDAKVYKGFVLMGECEVLLRNIVHHPCSMSDLNKQVSALNSHDNAIQRLTEIVSQVVLKVGGKLVKWDENRASTSSRYVADQLHNRAFTGTEFDEEVKRLVKMLRFGDEYWTVDEANTRKILDCLTSGSVPDDAPFYLGGEIWNSDNRYVRILAVFGDRAPCLSKSTGKMTVNLSKPGEVDPNLDGNPRKLPYLPVYKSGLLEAASSWQSIQSNKFVRCVESRQKGPGKLFDRKADVGHVAGDAFVAFYEKLRTFAYASGQVKRVREMDVDEVIKAGERVAKRKIEAEKAASFM